MSWKDLKIQYSIIVEKLKRKEDYSREWAVFSRLAFEIEKKPPPAVSEIHKSLKILEQKTNRNKIFILDHGCGAALKSIYLAVLGFQNVYGVNVNFNVDYVNQIMKDKFSFNKKKFLLTDGKKLPFPDKYFDFIISSQVVEHLTDEEVLMYYSEEGRVLKSFGLAYHELPHKYIPYESHSRLWLIHLFPYFCKPFLYGVFISMQKRKNLFFKGSYYARRFSKEFLILRSPSFHKKIVNKYIGSCEDLTLKRLLEKTDFSSYDMDSPLKIRKVLDAIFQLPFFGKFFALILKNFFILQTLSIKKK